MEVILLERIDRLGQMGDVVKVKSGYARNFLLPQKKALRATEENKKHFDSQRAQLEAVNLERREDAEKLGKKLEGLPITLIRQAGEAGQLYGSVNGRDIAASVTEAGFTITRQQVELTDPIKALGLYQVKVTLHPEVAVDVTANVARSEDEAKTQAKIGKAVVGIDEEEEKTVAAVTEETEQAAQKGDDETQAAEEAADEAATEQAEAIFEDGVVPETASDDEEAAEEEEKSE